ncbi:hypothetical protein J3E69DRAFT_365370 [Trichoderma sp. SZMC 28015]
MGETDKYKKQGNRGIDKQEREKGGRSNRSWAKQRREKREKKRQEKEKQEKEKPEKEKPEKEKPEKEEQEKEKQEKEKQEKEQQEKEQHEKDTQEKHEKEEHEKHEKHEKQNETALDWLQRELQALKQKYKALEQGIHTAKGNNQNFGEEIDELREEARKAFEDLQMIYAERITGKAHEMTQETRDQMRDQTREEEKLFEELIQEEMQRLRDQDGISSQQSFPCRRVHLNPTTRSIYIPRFLTSMSFMQTMNVLKLCEVLYILLHST